jgi:hypothetical protein
MSVTAIIPPDVAILTALDGSSKLPPRASTTVPGVRGTDHNGKNIVLHRIQRNPPEFRIARLQKKVRYQDEAVAQRPLFEIQDARMEGWSGWTSTCASTATCTTSGTVQREALHGKNYRNSLPH